MMETHWSSIPRAGNRLAIQEELVSVNSPINSSVPMPMISAFNSSPWVGIWTGLDLDDLASGIAYSASTGSVARARIRSMREFSMP